MNELFLHYLWKFRLANNLTTINGEPVEVIHPGMNNADAGPDFFNAKIKIGNTLWAGNVEIHLRTSDFEKHRHQQDKNYANLILHVVYEHDRPNNYPIPVTELKGRFSLSLLKNYLQLAESKKAIPCSSQIPNVKPLVIKAWMERMLAERLESKAVAVRQMLIENKHHWEETCYRLLAINFGFKLNAVPFEMLSRLTPLKVLARHKNNLRQIEAVLFGQAGLLPDKPADDYHASLLQEYRLIKNKFRLQPMEGSVWKFARTRPSNFPTLRLAQFASLIHQSSHLFSKILETEQAKQLITLFECEASDYWKTHFHFGKKSKSSGRKKLGAGGMENILINSVAPLLFLYGMEKPDERFKERAVSLLQHVPSEKNHILSLWKASGIPSKNAADSQALLQLKKYYCSPFRCLSCSIGNAILNAAVAHETTG
jgi:hypothetical protein